MRNKGRTPGAQILREWRRDGLEDHQVKRTFLTFLFIYVGIKLSAFSLFLVLLSIWLKTPFWLLIVVLLLMEFFKARDFWKQIKTEMGGS